MSLYQICLHITVYSVAAYCLLIWLAIFIGFVRAVLGISKEIEKEKQTLNVIQAPKKCGHYTNTPQSWENN